jgi:hypothetical protein
VEEIIKQNNYPSNTHVAQSKTQYCIRITENVVEGVIKNSKVNFQ